MPTPAFGGPDGQQGDGARGDDPGERARLLRVAGDWVWRIDERNRIVAVDGDLEVYTGLGPDEVIGRPRTDFADVRLDARAWAENMATIAARRPFRRFRWTMPTAGGQRLIEEIGEPVIDAEGIFRGYLIAASDLTVANAENETARRVGDLLREALDAIDDAFALYDQEDRLVLANGRFFTRFPSLAPVLVPGTPYGDLVDRRAARHELDLDGASVDAWIAARGARLGDEALTDERTIGDRRYLETEFRSNAGGRVLLISDVTALRESQSELEARVVELQASRGRLARQSDELSQLAETLAQARDAAEAANRAKTEFLATVSHELRTPLNVIIGFSQLIANENPDDMGPSRHVEYAGEILVSGQGLLAIINDIIDLANAEAGRVNLVCEPVTPAELFGPIVEAHRARAAERDIEFVIDAPDDLPRVDVDERRLRRALDHLVANAVRFGREGGAVRLRGRMDPRGVALSVIDDGIGIAPDDIARALESFGKVDSSHSRRHDGAGIGLTLARAMINLHGGDLSLESTVDVGTCVSLIVPPERILGGPAHPT